MKRIAKLAFVALFISGSASLANAQSWGHRGYGVHHGERRGGTSIGIQVGRVGIAFGTPRNVAPRYSSFHSGFGGYGRSAVGYGRRANWHDTSHFDYHGPTVVRHRNHYDYIPGHYDLHRTGHWDH